MGIVAMATRGQLDDIRALVEKRMEPADIANHFGRLADLDEIGRAKVASIASDMYEGVAISPDDHDLTEHSLD